MDVRNVPCSLNHWGVVATFGCVKRSDVQSAYKVLIDVDNFIFVCNFFISYINKSIFFCPYCCSDFVYHIVV